MVILIDNYDSFVHNLARYVRLLGVPTRVFRNDAVDVKDIEELNPAAILISPGPCTPDEAGCSVDVVRQLGSRIPILGICLGHQAIVQAFGGRIVKANQPVHGKSSIVEHQGDGIFEGIPSPFTVGRYHSLVAETESLPQDLVPTAHLADGTIMAVQHRLHRIVGLQFHPESILTEHGSDLLKNFLIGSPAITRT